MKIKTKMNIWTLISILTIAFEIFALVQWINPFFWSPGIAYTDIAWLYPLIIMVLILIPGAIFEQIHSLWLRKEMGEE